MAESHDALQAQFVELTGADAATAHFYLESSGWKLDAATATFFDNAGGMSSPVAAPPAAKPAPPHSTPMPHAQPAHVGGGGHQASAPGPMPSSKPAGAKRPPASRGGGSRVKTFGEIRSAESDEEEEDKEQSYYAGGAASGQMVKSGSRKPAADPADIVKNVFESAKSHGAEVVDPHEHGGKEEKAKAFEGTGFRLGTSISPSMPDPATVKKPAAHAPPKDRLVVITFWRTGFSIDDGPLRKFDDPANKPFLEDVHSGHIPRELHALAQGAQLNVNLVDKSHEDYTAPKVVVKPFAGAGMKLGNTAAPAPAAAAAPAASPAPPAAPSVDGSQPLTTLQIRLADGTRLVAKFNHTATVAQLRAFIDAARVGSKAYQLQTPMPVVILTDNSKTLKELGLLNATVIQKML